MAGGQAPEASPGRYEIDDDCADVLGVDVRGPDADPFDIPAKRAPVERLRRWRQAALVLNANRRFRYTLDLKKEEEKEQIRRKIRAHAQVIRAALLFKEAGEKPICDRELPEILPRRFGIGEEQLTVMTRDHNYSTLQEYGGVKGLANLLKTNLDKGIHGDEADLSCRANAFGANRYPRKKGRSFWVFLWEACQDMTLVILIIAPIVSLVSGIAKKKGVPSAESSHTRWGLGKGISRQPYPCKIPLKFCKEAGSNPGPPGHKWRVYHCARSALQYWALQRRVSKKDGMMAQVLHSRSFL